MRISVLLQGFERYVSNICLAAFVVVLALQVFFRYVLHQGLSWSEEVSRFLFIWFVYVSASYAVQKGTHIRVTAVVDLLPERFAPAVRVLSDLVWVGFNAVVVVSGVLLTRDMIAYPVFSTSLLLPLAVIQSVIPIAHALMIVRIAQSYRNGRGTWAAREGPP